MSDFEQNPEVVATELEVGIVLLNLQTGLYYSLNESAAEIWRGLPVADGSQTLAGRLGERFDVDPQRAATATRALLVELEREQLVVRGDGGEGRRASSPSGANEPPAAEREPFAEPELVKHDEPLHEISMSPFDPQLPLAE
jgi:Coenzyme PQQ synthesis protein D (PqqD)